MTSVSIGSKRLKRLACFAAFSCLMFTSAQALTQLWTVSGTVSGTVNTGASFTVGQRWTATFTVNDAAPAGDSGADYAGYENAAGTLTFSTAGYSLSAPSSTAWFYVYNDDVFGTPVDLLEASFHSPSGPSFSGKAPSLFQFVLRDSDRSSIGATSIPTAIDLSTWTNDNASYFYWGTGPTRSELILAVDTLAIPEPSSAAFLLGTLSLLRATGRKKRTARRAHPMA